MIGVGLHKTVNAFVMVSAFVSEHLLTALLKIYTEYF